MADLNKNGHSPIRQFSNEDHKTKTTMTILGGNVQSNEFKTIPLNELGKKRVNLIHATFQDLLDELESICYRDDNWIATKHNLKCAAFFAVRSMCNKKENQL